MYVWRWQVEVNAFHVPLLKDCVKLGLGNTASLSAALITIFSPLLSILYISKDPHVLL